MSEQAETATSSSTTDAAKQEASRVGQQAGQTGQHVASVASDEVGALASEAGRHAQDLLSEARSSLTQQAATQQSALSSFLRTVADDLHAMVERSSDSRSSDSTANSTDKDGSSTGAGVAGQTVREVSSRAGQAASWLQDHEPADLLDEVTRFARQRPGAFLLAAGVAGLVAGRLTRGLKDDAGDSPSRSSVETRPAPSTSSYVSPEEYAGQSRPGQVPAAAVVDVDDE